MSRENVEVVRRAFELFMERTGPSDQAAAVFDEGLLASTATLTPARERPDWRIYVGREGLTEFLQAWTEDFLEWRISQGDAVGVER